MSLTEIISIISTFLFGGAGVVTLILAKRERKANASILEANANLEMQKGYAQFVIDTNLLIAALKTELNEVRAEIRKYRIQCEKCVNNKF